MLGDTVKHLEFSRHVGRYGKKLGVPKTCWEIQLSTWGSQNILWDTTKCLQLPEHLGRYSRTLVTPKTCCEIL